MEQVGICKWNEPAIAIYNNHDTGIKLSRNTWVANGKNCDEETQYLANLALLKQLKEIDKNIQISPGLESAVRTEIGSMTTGNLEKMCIQDKKHFDTSIEDSKTYIIKTLKHTRIGHTANIKTIAAHPNY